MMLFLNCDLSHFAFCHRLRDELVNPLLSSDFYDKQRASLQKAENFCDKLNVAQFQVRVSVS